MSDPVPGQTQSRLVDLIDVIARSVATKQSGLPNAVHRVWGPYQSAAWEIASLHSQETNGSGGIAKGFALDDGLSVCGDTIVKAGGLGDATQRRELRHA